MPVLARAYDRGAAIGLISVGVDYQIRETFESALLFGGATLEKLGVDQAEVAEVIEDVRRRDAERLELQIAGDIQAGRGLMKGNIPEPVPTPLTPPKRPGQAMNEGAADALGKAGSRAEEDANGGTRPKGGGSRRVLAARPEKKPGSARTAEFDAGFHDRFRELHFAAARRELDHWIDHPESALALMILLDQFPRNCFRGTGHMYATDPLARHFRQKGAGCRATLEAVGDAAALLLPLAVRAFGRFGRPAFCSRTDCAPLREEYVKYAIEHRDIIERFGRFPHRNPHARPRDDARRAGLSRLLAALPVSADCATARPSTSRGRTAAARCQPYRHRQDDPTALAAGDEIRRDLGQRHQHEGALEHARMGNLQPVFVDGAIAEDQYVDVDQPRAPALLAHALQLALGLQAKVEQAARRQAGRNLRRGVEKIRLVGLAPGRRAVERRDRHHVRQRIGVEHPQAPRPSTLPDRRDCRRG